MYIVRRRVNKALILAIVEQRDAAVSQRSQQDFCIACDKEPGAGWNQRCRRRALGVFV